MVLNIAEWGASTRNANLELALCKPPNGWWATGSGGCPLIRCVHVQTHYTEPPLNVADYLCWSVQRVFERGETRCYDFLGDRINLLVDLYSEHSDESRREYGGTHRVTRANKMSPPAP
jgi:hypothetical protein